MKNKFAIAFLAALLAVFTPVAGFADDHGDHGSEESHDDEGHGDDNPSDHA